MSSGKSRLFSVTAIWAEHLIAAASTCRSSASGRLSPSISGWQSSTKRSSKSPPTIAACHRTQNALAADGPSGPDQGPDDQSTASRTANRQVRHRPEPAQAGFRQVGDAARREIGGARCRGNGPHAPDDGLCQSAFSARSICFAPFRKRTNRRSETPGAH